MLCLYHPIGFWWSIHALASLCLSLWSVAAYAKIPVWFGAFIAEIGQILLHFMRPKPVVLCIRWFGIALMRMVRCLAGGDAEFRKYLFRPTWP